MATLHLKKGDTLKFVIINTADGPVMYAQTSENLDTTPPTMVIDGATGNDITANAQFETFPYGGTPLAPLNTTCIFRQRVNTGDASVELANTPPIYNDRGGIYQLML